MDILKHYCFFGVVTLLAIGWSNIRKETASIIMSEKELECPSDSLAVSTCGCRGDERGRHQKIVAYSLYGNFSDQETRERYVEPMAKVVDQVRSAYSGWIVRIYTTEEHSRILEKIFETDKHVDICVVETILDEARPHLLKSNLLIPSIWRFLPLLDPTVDFFMSRDADSYIFDREIDAVQEWLNGSAAFHVMRDHQGHCKNPRSPRRKYFFTIS